MTTTTITRDNAQAKLDALNNLALSLGDGHQWQTDERQSYNRATSALARVIGGTLVEDIPDINRRYDRAVSTLNIALNRKRGQN